MILYTIIIIAFRRFSSPFVVTMFECSCGKKYKYASGLTNHKEKCSIASTGGGAAAAATAEESGGAGAAAVASGGDPNDIANNIFFTTPLTSFKPTANFTKEDLEMLEKRKQARLKAILQAQKEQEEKDKKKAADAAAFAAAKAQAQAIATATAAAASAANAASKVRAAGGRGGGAAAAAGELLQITRTMSAMKSIMRHLISIMCVGPRKPSTLFAQLLPQRTNFVRDASL